MQPNLVDACAPVDENGDKMLVSHKAPFCEVQFYVDTTNHLQYCSQCSCVATVNHCQLLPIVNLESHATSG